MANIKANIKSIGKAEKRNNRNKIVKTTYKTALKNTRKTNSQDELNVAYKSLDQAASKKVITKNKANRLKSRAAKRANKANAQPKVAPQAPKKAEEKPAAPKKDEKA